MMFILIKTTAISIVATALIILALPLIAQAQEAKPARIGFLGWGKPNVLNLEGFRQGMRDRGHVEGKTYALVPAWGKPGFRRKDRGVLTKKLVASGVHVIVTLGSSATRLANRMAPSIPIVMAESAAPVRAGLIKSFAKPGGNVTGVSSAAVNASVKGMEILKQLVPGLRRIGTIHRGPGGRGRVSYKMWSAADKLAAETLGVEVIRFHPIKRGDFDTLLTRMASVGIGAISVRSTNSLSAAQRKRLVQVAIREKLPSISTRKEMVKQGALASLGPSYPRIFRRVAAYVDLILKGAKPSDLPVEVASRFDLVINLKTAKALGITIPTALLLRADEVIE